MTRRMRTALGADSRSMATPIYRLGRPLFHDLVRAREQSCRDGETECYRGLQIDHQLEMGRLQDRQVCGFVSVQYLRDVSFRFLIGVEDAGAVAHQAADRRKFAHW